MSGERIVLIAPHRALIAQALSLGLDPFVVFSQQDVDSACLELTTQALLVDYRATPILIPQLKALHDVTPFTGVLSLSEKGLLPAAVLAEALELPGLSPRAVELTRDKLLMREQLKNLCPVKAALVHTRHQLREFGEFNGGPVVVKPRHGFAGAGVRFVESPYAIEELAEESWPLLAEEYLDGKELSVEAFSLRGCHTVFAINEETNLSRDAASPFMELAHRLPANISPDDTEKTVTFVSRVLDELGIVDGPTHTEVILTANGPRLVETHTRLAGDKIPQLIQLATGIDLTEVALQWASNREVHIPSVPKATRGAAIRFFTPPPGQLLAVHGLTENTEKPGVVEVSVRIKPGEEIRPLKSSKDRVGYVITVGNTAIEASRIAESVIDTTVFEVAD